MRLLAALEPPLVLVDELEAALDRYAGALVVVTHGSRWHGTTLALKESSLASH